MDPARGKSGREDALEGAFLATSAPRLPMPQWVERNRIIVETAMPGRWDWRHGFMTREPLAAVSDPAVSFVALLTPTQLAKTEFAINVALATVDYGDTCLLYEPDKPLLQSVIADRVRPAAQALGTTTALGLDDKLVKRRDTRVELRLAGRGIVKGLTPMMRTGDAAYSARVVVVDEVDRMARPDMRIVARSRTTTYGDDAIVVFVGTPTYDSPGSMWRYWSEGSRGVWRGVCQTCKERVSLDWNRVHLRTDGAGYWLSRWGDRLSDVAALVCESCDRHWPEAERLAAVRAGCYVHEHPDHPDRTFRIPGAAHLWRTVEQIVADGAREYRAGVDDHDWSGFRLWTMEQKALPWEDDARGLSATKMSGETFSLRARGENDRGELDREALVITVGADVGRYGIFAEWVAWGIDAKTGEVRSWGLQYRVFGGTAEDTIEEPFVWDEFYSEVEAARWRLPLESGKVMAARRVLIDARHRPEIVLAHVRRWYAVELAGTPKRKPEPYGARCLPMMSFARERVGTVYPIDLALGMRRKSAGKGKVLKLKLPCVVWVHSGALKDQGYTWKMADRRRPAGVAPLHVWPHDGEALGYDGKYFRQLANEIRVTQRVRGETKTVWEERSPAVSNEALDCRVYALAAAYTLAHPKPLAAVLAAQRDKRKPSIGELVTKLADVLRGEDSNVLPFEPPLD